jgi:hypothetical protein
MRKLRPRTMKPQKSQLHSSQWNKPLKSNVERRYSLLSAVFSILCGIAAVFK